MTAVAIMAGMTAAAAMTVTAAMTAVTIRPVTREGYRDARRHDRRPPHGWARGHDYRRGYRGPVYVVNDYHHYDLRRPPRGHHWVRDDRGNYLLVAVATGIIADLLLHH